MRKMALPYLISEITAAKIKWSDASIANQGTNLGSEISRIFGT